MRGTVKWFSKEKGYGFITDEASVDRHFSVRDVSGSELPPIGSIIEFEPSMGKKGPRAQAVRIISLPQLTISKSQPEIEDRVICSRCGKKMVPRLITHRGDVQRSVCPFCGATHKDFGFPWHWLLLIGGVVWGIYSAFNWFRGLFA